MSPRPGGIQVLPPPTFEEATGPDALETFGAQLDDLHSAVGASVVARRSYLDSWVRTYGEYEPWIIALCRGRELQGAFPLARRRRGGWTKVVSIGHGVSGHTWIPALSKSAAEALGAETAARLQAMSGRWKLSVRHLHPDDPAAQTLHARLPTSALTPGDGAPLLPFDRGRDLRDYMSHNLRRTLQKRLNRIHRAGLTESVERVDDPIALSLLLPELDALRRRRAQSFGADVNLTGAHSQFRVLALERLAQDGAVEVTTFRLNGELAAYAIGLRDGTCYRMWETRFEPSRSWFGVGLLVQEAVLKHVLADSRFVECDLQRGLDQHKLQLTQTIVAGNHLTAWSSPWFRARDHLARHGRTLAYYKWLGRYAYTRLRRSRTIQLRRR